MWNKAFDFKQRREKKKDGELTVSLGTADIIENRQNGLVITVRILVMFDTFLKLSKTCYLDT